MPDSSLQGRKIAFLVAPEGIEQAELTGPWKAVEEDGGRPVLLSTQAGRVQAFDHLDEVVVDVSGPGPLITSRNPDDIAAFDAALLAHVGA